MLHPQLLSELEELLRQKGLLENDPQSEIVPKAPVFRGAAPSMPLACPNCEEDDNTSYFDDILGLLNCCFSKRMRKVFKKNEKSMLQFCNKNSKKKRAFTMG